MHKQMQTKTNQRLCGNTHTPPHIPSSPLGRAVFADNFVIICFGFAWFSSARACSTSKVRQ